MVRISVPLSDAPPTEQDGQMEYLKKVTQQCMWKKEADDLISGKVIKSESKQCFHTHWIEAGAKIRQQINSDTVLIQLLRLILPRYSGDNQILYRGENLQRFREKRIGFCWTTSMETARMFGRGLNSTPNGGVLLKISAYPEAIIASPNEHSKWLGEHEYTLDPSKISDVEKLEQYPPQL